jgi:VIT1/CCC1 family predicted Fe2+/Mn2+ transporter
MNPENEITLRLRFYKDISENIEHTRLKFEHYSNAKPGDFIIKKADNHIWINIATPKKRYWTPHLHLELVPKGNCETHIRGLYGPDPTLWTFFMFLHFIIAGVFLIFSAIAYSDYVLKNSTTLDLTIMALMVVFWFSLYYLAKSIRKKGHQQMNELETCFNTILKS